MPDDSTSQECLSRLQCWLKLKQRLEFRSTLAPARTLIFAQQARANSSSPARPPGHFGTSYRASDSKERRRSVHFHDLPVPRHVSRVMLATKQNPLTPSENWDDDFDFQLSATATKPEQQPEKPSFSTRHSIADSLAWDDEPESTNDGVSPGTQSRQTGSHKVEHSSWEETSDDGLYDQDYEPDSSPSDIQRVTNAHLCTTIMSASQPGASTSQYSMVSPSNNGASLSSPNLPRLPSHQFPYHTPTSPTISSLSIEPRSPSRSSSTHLRGSPSLGSTLALLPSQHVVQTPRVRRRLRKKSRPSGIDDDVWELQAISADRSNFASLDENDAEDPFFEDDEPVTVTATSGGLPLMDVGNSMQPRSESSLATPVKAPLLTRLGSIKKWGTRKNSDAPRPHSSLHAGPRTPDPPLVPPSNRAWIFRSGSSNHDTQSPETARKIRQAKRRGSVPAPGTLPSDTAELRSIELDARSGTVARKSKKSYSKLPLLSRVMSAQAQAPHSDSSASSIPAPDVSKRPMSLQPQPRRPHPEPERSRSGSGSQASSSHGKRAGAAIRSVSSPFNLASNSSRPSLESRHEDRLAELGKMNLSRTSLSGTRRSASRSHSRNLSLPPDRPVTPTRSSSPPPAPPSNSPPPPVPPLAFTPNGSVQARSSLLPTIPSPISPIPPEPTTTSAPALLPPIELFPPSPPRKETTAEPAAPRTPSPSPSPKTSKQEYMARSFPYLIASSPRLNASPGSPGLGQSVSLGRATISPSVPSAGSPRFVNTPTRPSEGSRSAIVLASSNEIKNGMNPFIRRNSLGDLKIPARISMAQSGLKNHMWMVREFAANVEQLKRLQATRNGLLGDLASSNARGSGKGLQTGAIPFLVRRNSKHGTQRSTNHKLQALEDQYALWWECAELLVELGGGTSVDGDSPPPKSSRIASPELTQTPSRVRTPRVSLDRNAITPSVTPVPAGRERAITLANSQSATFSLMSKASKPPAPNKWRASAGRHDLSQRQLSLLKDMLATPDPAAYEQSPPPSNRSQLHAYQSTARPATASAITLPQSSPSSSAAPSVQRTTDNATPPPRGEGKIRRASRAGLTGLRDMLKGLKRGGSGHQMQQQQATTLAHLAGQHRQSTPSIPASTEDSGAEEQHQPRSNSVMTGRARASTDVRSAHPNSPYNPTAHRKSPRRPSLASIFRIGQSSGHVPKLPKQKGSSRSQANSRSATEEDANDDDVSDWDRMDDASDFDATTRIHPEKNEATIRGRRARPQSPTPAPRTPSNARSLTASASASQTSLRHRTSPVISFKNRLKSSASDPTSHQPSRPLSRSRSRRPPSALATAAMRYGHVPPPTIHSAPPTELSDPRLALTPDNIRPLLDYAREVSSRLNECLAELRALCATLRFDAPMTPIY